MKSVVRSSSISTVSDLRWLPRKFKFQERQWRIGLQQLFSNTTSLITNRLADMTKLNSSDKIIIATMVTVSFEWWDNKYHRGNRLVKYCNFALLRCKLNARFKRKIQAQDSSTRFKHKIQAQDSSARFKRKHQAPKMRREFCYHHVFEH